MRKKTNRIIRLLTLALIAVALLLPMALTAGAEEADTEAIDGSTSDTATEDDGAVSAPGADALNSFFAVLLEHSAEIMCALTVLGTALVAMAYRRGLLPMLRAALGSIGNAVKSIDESTERGGGNIESLREITEKQLTALTEKLEELGARIDGTAERVSTLCKSEDAQARLAAALEEEAEMLYDLLMTSALPVYQKDAISERMKKIKERESSEVPRTEN